jgi:hypothetical protein
VGEANKRALLLAEEDAQIGKRVKELARRMTESSVNDVAMVETCARVICGTCARLNASDTKIEMPILTDKGYDVGGWEITIKRVREPKKP